MRSKRCAVQNQGITLIEIIKAITNTSKESKMRASATCPLFLVSNSICTS